MVAEDQYEFEIGSVQTLIGAWRQSAQEAGEASRQLAEIRDRLESSVPSALMVGSAQELVLAECLEAVGAAVGVASSVAHGLAQDTSTLEANLRAYVAAEREVEARLKAVHGAKPVRPLRPVHGSGSVSGGSTQTSGGGGSSASKGGGRPSSGGGRSSGGGPSPGGGRGGGVGGPGTADSSGNSLHPPGPAAYANQAQVENWINQAFKVLEAEGVPASELNEAGVLLIIEHESSGNPNAINSWDSNAKAGDPSRGLMQVIGATFSSYRLPGHGNIYNPVDNIIAGVRYALARYGSIRNVPGVKSVNRGGSYVGY